MRADIRRILVAVSFALVAPSSLVLSSRLAVAQNAESDQPPQVQQMALTEKQVSGVIQASKAVDAVMSKLPQDKEPDAKAMAKLDAAAKSAGFASYEEYQQVTDNIMLVMNGIDPSTKKYVGPEAVAKMQIEELKSDKNMSQQQKQDAINQVNAMAKAAPAIKFQDNVALVTKHYDQLAALLQPEQ